MDKRVLGVLGVLVVAALACGSQGATPTSASRGETGVSTVGAVIVPTDAPSPASVGIGERVEDEGVALTVASIKTLTVVKEIFKPQTEGNVFLVCEVLLENTGADPAAYNPLYFKLKDGEGFEYNVTLMAPDPSLLSGELAVGDKARGNIAFEVKATAKGLTLTYAPIQFGNNVSLKVALGDAPRP